MSPLRSLTIPVPRNWTSVVRSATLHAIALASMARAVARGRATVRSQRRRQSRQTELELATTEVALLREELAIKDSRWERLPSRRRPHYSPHERLRILQLRAARGWSCEETAHRLFIDEQTLRSWLGRVDEEGDRALVRLATPVNRFPDLVRYLPVESRRVTAKRPDHVWHLDLTTIPTSAGFWVP